MTYPLHCQYGQRCHMINRLLVAPQYRHRIVAIQLFAVPPPTTIVSGFGVYTLPERFSLYRNHLLRCPPGWQLAECAKGIVCRWDFVAGHADPALPLDGFCATDTKGWHSVC